MGRLDCSARPCASPALGTGNCVKSLQAIWSCFRTNDVRIYVVIGSVPADLNRTFFVGQPYCPTTTGKVSSNTACGMSGASCGIGDAAQIIAMAASVAGDCTGAGVHARITRPLRSIVKRTSMICRLV